MPPRRVSYSHMTGFLNISSKFQKFLQILKVPHSKYFTFNKNYFLCFWFTIFKFEFHQYFIVGDFCLNYAIIWGNEIVLLYFSRCAFEHPTWAVIMMRISS